MEEQKPESWWKANRQQIQTAHTHTNPRNERKREDVINDDDGAHYTPWWWRLHWKRNTNRTKRKLFRLLHSWFFFIKLQSLFSILLWLVYCVFACVCAAVYKTARAMRWKLFLYFSRLTHLIVSHSYFIMQTARAKLHSMLQTKSSACHVCKGEKSKKKRTHTHGSGKY